MGYDKGSDHQWQQLLKFDNKEKPPPPLHPPPLEVHRYRTRLGKFATRLPISMHNHNVNRPTSRDGRQVFQEECYSGSRCRGRVLELDLGEAVGWRRGGHSNDYNPLKSTDTSSWCPMQLPPYDRLVCFVVMMLTNEFCLLMPSNPCFRWLRSLHLLPWSITSL